MAQGFVKNLNLVESDSQSSDRNILDNLGGQSITSDILLFDGNNRFKSVLSNNSTATSTTITNFGDFTPTKQYKIETLGNGRSTSWTNIGADGSPAVGEIFTVNSTDQSTQAGTGGTAKEIVPRVDFNNVNDVTDGYTLVVVGENRVAFSNNTQISINGGTTYPYKVFNSNAEDRFQLVPVATSNPTSGDAINLSSVITSMADVTLTRNDAITITNFDNFSPTVLLTNDEADEGGANAAGDPENLQEADDGSNDGGFDTFSQTAYIGQILAKVKYKKTRVPLTYQDSLFDERVRFGGEVTVTNSGNIEIGYPRTLTTALIAGVSYKIVSVGSTTLTDWAHLGADSSATAGEVFIATGATIRSSADGGGALSGIGDGTVKASSPPGLFILNTADNTEVRAFSGTDNPWDKDESTPSFISGNALKTSSNKAQATDLLFDPSSNNTPILVKTNLAQDTAVDVVTNSSPGSTFTHKIPVNVNGEQFFLLVTT